MTSPSNVFQVVAFAHGCLLGSLLISSPTRPAQLQQPIQLSAAIHFAGCRPGRANATSRLSGQAHWHRGVSSACVARHQPSPRGFLGILDERHVSRSQLSCGIEVQSPRSARIFDKVLRPRTCCCAGAQRLCGRKKNRGMCCMEWRSGSAAFAVACRSTAAARWKSGAPFRLAGWGRKSSGGSTKKARLGA